MLYIITIVSEVLNLQFDIVAANKLFEPKVIEAEIIRFVINAQMDSFECSICTEKKLLTHTNIQGRLYPISFPFLLLLKLFERKFVSNPLLLTSSSLDNGN